MRIYLLVTMLAGGVKTQKLVGQAADVCAVEALARQHGRTVLVYLGLPYHVNMVDGKMFYTDLMDGLGDSYQVMRCVHRPARVEQVQHPEEWTIEGGRP